MQKIPVEVVYASTKETCLLALALAPGATVEQAIRASGILEQFPEIDLTTNPIGIFSRPVSLTTIVQANDRIEIYRPLTIDPKQARFLRVDKKRR